MSTVSKFISEHNINRDFILFTLIVLALCYLYHDSSYLKKEELLKKKKTELEKLREDTEKLTKAVGGDFKEKERNLKILKEEYNKLEKEQRRLFSRFPSKAEASRMLEDIVSEKKFRHLTFESYYPSDEVPTGSGYNYIPIEVKVSGSFSRMGEYIKYIEDLPRIIVIDNIAFQTTREEDRVTGSNVTLMANTYVLQY